MANVVVVDKTPEVRQELSKAITESLPGGLVIACEDGESALDVLRTTPVDILALDAGLDTGVDIISVILAAAARHRRATVLVRADSGVDVAVRGGIGRIVASDDDISRLIEALVETANDRHDRAMQLSELSLLRILEETNLAEWSGALAVRDGPRSGIVAIAGGNLVHARFDGDDGEPGLSRMLRLVGGTLTECNPPADLVVNVDRPTATLLAEAAAIQAAGGDELEITEEDVVDFMGLSQSGQMEPAFELFSKEELAELAIDDGMAIPIPRSASPNGGEPVIDGGAPTVPRLEAVTDEDIAAAAAEALEDEAALADEVDDTTTVETPARNVAALDAAAAEADAQEDGARREDRATVVVAAEDATADPGDDDREFVAIIEAEPGDMDPEVEFTLSSEHKVVTLDDSGDAG